LDKKLDDLKLTIFAIQSVKLAP